MDLILWRHAEAEDLDETDQAVAGDLSRRLTPRGDKQAARMAAWLDRQLPEGVRIWCSPAVRTEQTVLALGRKYRVRDELRPDGSVDDLLGLVQWPDARQAALIVGHQPTLGRVAARLLNLAEPECSLRKGAVWWLRQREKHGQTQTILLTVQTPEML
ncbi:MAG TPA: histidine phosphatase family protein [Macromonas sp.]|nr:histidine phosphatase family protein [Macromonas sp.]